MPTIVQQINDRGWGKGWHADMLKAQAKARGVTMAAQFSENIANAAAFNVPAIADKTKSTPHGHFAHFVFADGSEGWFGYNPNGFKNH